MHEMGIALQIIDIVKSAIPSHDIKVKKVNLKIGKLSAVVPESLRFCFDVVKKETPLSNAILYVEETPVVLKCKQCNNQWTIKDLVFICTKCSSSSVDIISGRELDIHSMEVEE
ncbi:MAG: hydrogenase maturation nickel metallochaperone HypA [Desulfobacterales bacterium]|nr:hydrogenase maturation nickel metallochaperone HypA [Desulfobacterales bacterium]MBF0395555.1 hydrogenase maturation nickel metallochaperone HypA [Desulfobacterales bacterium]